MKKYEKFSKFGQGYMQCYKSPSIRHEEKLGLRPSKKDKPKTMSFKELERKYGNS
jgi:hypothetical protein